MRYLNFLFCHFEVECLAEAVKKERVPSKMIRGTLLNVNEDRAQSNDRLNLILLSIKFSNVRFQNKM